MVRVTANRLDARARTRKLLEQDSGAIPVSLPEQNQQQVAVVNKLDALDHLLLYADSKIGKSASICLCLLCAASAIGACISFLSVYCLPLFGFIGFCIPLLYLNGRASKRAQLFAEDYPSVLLATASSIKAGMTPLQALERAVELLPPKSLCKTFTDNLMNELASGVCREKALRDYAHNIALPELDLFRSAFLLVLENGGKFSPTLERLAMVTRDRTTLIGAAGVSTASMRMTGNVLLAVIPIILGFMSAGNPAYWEHFLHHPTANSIASVGIVVITFGYLILHRMSLFRP